jgi:hypothetical protein
MTLYTDTYEVVQFGECVADIDVRFQYSVFPGRPAQIYGPPERCYPEEPHEIELEEIELPWDKGWKVISTKHPLYDTLEEMFNNVEEMFLLDNAVAERW